MTKVFIGGSRHLSRVAETVRERIDRIIDKNLPVLIGDAGGADKAVQTYLNQRRYQNVEVFCSGESARNNIGGWPVRSVETGFSRGSLDFYTAKDRTMTDEATVGLMIWDGKSSGTIRNVFRLLNQQKKVAVYISAEKHFWDLTGLEEWDEFISRFPPELRMIVDQNASSDGARKRLSPTDSSRSPQQSRSGADSGSHLSVGKRSRAASKSGAEAIPAHREVDP